MFGAKRLILEFDDGTQQVYDRPDDSSIGWWHGTQDNLPGIYVVVRSWENWELFPVGRLRRIKTIRG